MVRIFERQNLGDGGLASCLADRRRSGLSTEACMTPSAHFTPLKKIAAQLAPESTVTLDESKGFKCGGKNQPHWYFRLRAYRHSTSEGRSS
jgi:hypothetical protein